MTKALPFYLWDLTAECAEFAAFRNVGDMRQVTVWSLAERKAVAEFDTIPSAAEPQPKMGAGTAISAIAVLESVEPAAALEFVGMDTASLEK